MAVTHADLAPKRKKTDLGSKTGLFLVVLCILFGLLCFICCLVAEATRSEATWISTTDKGNTGDYECTYSSSGRTPLLSAAGAFLALGVAMMIIHTYLLYAVSKSTSPDLIAWDPDSDFAKSLTWQAGFFFVATWICFAVGEILLLIGLSVESGHLTNWDAPKTNCLIIRQGLFCSAGVFGLLTVFLAAGLYMTALRAYKYLQEQEHIRREVLEASVFYASPPTSPRRIRAVANENPIVTQNQNHHSLLDYLAEFDKLATLI
ncbi:hypothetical protein LIER_35566 [Lithospermum erythrorhizon]|uniref:Transmembrane protein n=1 Tax=Lithospermum erythrorhizon TaxID=34254 RepID=A0AAV3NVG2_LITER